ncbi:MAG: hypothetical protein LBG50_02865 [Clostridiales Family XIII bacterium]|jgi:hypothetical protein|nr:hypothetical protein [Clostridiales Family XIII bacterium]
MTIEQLKIIFVLVLCAPIAYFGVRFFISLVNHAVAGKEMAEKERLRRSEAANMEPSPAESPRRHRTRCGGFRGDADTPRRTGRRGRRG